MTYRAVCCSIIMFDVGYLGYKRSVAEGKCSGYQCRVNIHDAESKRPLGLCDGIKHNIF